MEYEVYRVGSGFNRPPMYMGEGSLEDCRKIGQDYLLDLYGKLPTRESSDLDNWVEIERGDGCVVEAIYPSHGRKSQFITKKFPYGQWTKE